MNDIAAVILAGGQAERLGGINKAELRIGGQTLLEIVSAGLSDCHPVLLAAGRRPFTAPGLLTIADIDADYRGPLAGLAAAVAHLLPDPPTLLLSVAVDTPFFPADFSGRARECRADAVLAAYAGQDYPTNALWRFSAVADLPAAVRNGTAPHSLKRLAAGLGAVSIDYATHLAEDPFLNVNTPADLALARARAGH